MLRLEPRQNTPSWVEAASPVLALGLTILAGGILFAILGKNPVAATRMIFVDPLLDPFSRSELLVKAAPLAMIAIGLAIGFRAGIWNIGAGGQFMVGALAGGAVGLAFHGVEAAWLLPLMALAGALGGVLWAMIPALLRVRYNANEILVSLMLVYVAELLVSALVSGPLRNPDGFNFPESRLFHASATLPILLPGTRVHLGVAVALGVVLVAALFLEKHLLGYRVRLMGSAPRAAEFSGVRPSGMVITCLAISGGLAGLAGLFEVAGPIGQIVPALPFEYGFTAIIVAFLGRLSPFGILLASLVMALTYIGGETAQFGLQIPAAAIQVVQGLLLFFLLATDVLTRFRVVRRVRA